MGHPPCGYWISFIVIVLLCHLTTGLFVFGRGVSFWWVLASTASCNFGALAGGNEYTFSYSTIFSHHLYIIFPSCYSSVLNIRIRAPGSADICFFLLSFLFFLHFSVSCHFSYICLFLELDNVLFIIFQPVCVVLPPPPLFPLLSLLLLLICA